MVALACLAAPLSAHAGSAAVVDGGLRFFDDRGQSNDVTITQAVHAVWTPGCIIFWCVPGPDTGPVLVVTDAHPIAPGGGCTPVTARAVACTPDTPVRVEIALVDGNDRFRPLRARYSGIERLKVHGGAGDDELVGTGNRMQLFGSDGDDTLHVEASNDYVGALLSGGTGDDLVTGGARSDELYGDSGADVIATHEPGQPPGGFDKVYARDGERDEVSCGDDPDGPLVEADELDVIVGSPGCTRVNRG